MLCSNCGKREADVLIKQVVANEVYDMNLCRVCAEEMGFISSDDTPSITISFSFRDAGMLQLGRALNSSGQSAPDYSKLRCPACGTEFGEFEQDSLLGCPKCYETFRMPLGEYLQRTQGAESHICSSESFSELAVWEPKEDDTRMPVIIDEDFADAMCLEHEMVDAISKEEYERATVLRDKLRLLGFRGGGA